MSEDLPFPEMPEDDNSRLLAKMAEVIKGRTSSVSDDQIMMCDLYKDSDLTARIVLSELHLLKLHNNLQLVDTLDDRLKHLIVQRVKLIDKAHSEMVEQAGMMEKMRSGDLSPEETTEMQAVYYGSLAYLYAEALMVGFYAGSRATECMAYKEHTEGGETG